MKDPSGSENNAEQRYRACAVDPEGPRVRSSVSGDSKVEAAFKDILMFKYDE